MKEKRRRPTFKHGGEPSSIKEGGAVLYNDSGRRTFWRGGEKGKRECTNGEEKRKSVHHDAKLFAKEGGLFAFGEKVTAQCNW